MDLCAFLAFLVFLLSFCRFLRFKEEFPLLISGLGFLAILRGVLVINDIADRVSFDYGIGAFTDSDMVSAGYLILLGTVVMTATFVYFSRNSAQRPLDNQELLTAFMTKHFSWAIVAVVAFIVAGLIAASIAKSELEMSDQTNSYATLFSMAGSSLIGLLFVAASQLRMSRSVVVSSYAAILILSVLSIATGMRFRVFGWVAIIVYVCFQRASATKQVAIYSIVILVLGFSLTILGAMRHAWISESSVQEKAEIGMTSLLSLSDVNFIEGMAMLLNVYPEFLEYSIGGEHLEILYRPIPRSWWPSKPVGGWHQKLGARQGGTIYRTGIAPSLFGSFYQEGGWIGIAICSGLYGWCFAKINNYSKRYDSSVGQVMRAVTFASFFALFRGGDLPGCFAFVGMSFWPLIVVLYYYHRFLDSEAMFSRHFEPKQ